MAISPLDSRLHPYLNGTIKPVWKKLSPSKCVSLYLLHRDYWCNSEFRDCKLSMNPSEPEHNGIIEGVAQFSPWMLQYKGTLHVEVCARCRISPLDLNEFDSVKDEIVFSKRVMLCPGFTICDYIPFNSPPDDIYEYSTKLQELYEKLGGPCASKFADSTEHREKPYRTYNFPFRFDINSGPDSITVKSIRPNPISGNAAPKTRQELYNDAIYGFQVDEYSDYDFSSDSDDNICQPRIRHPGEPIKKSKAVRRIDIKRQSIKDDFHADSYPWRPRRKPHPKAGIYWSLRVYALDLDETKPDVKNIAQFKIRKMTYIPIDTVMRLPLAPQINTDYVLIVNPLKSSDGGVITLVAQLDKVFYRMGEPIQVNIKIHNSSCRVIQQVNIEVIQSIRLKHASDKEWRNVICRKEVTAERDDNEMPILPATEKLRMQCRLCPWKSVIELDKNKFPVDSDSESLYSVHQRARYEIFPQRRPAFSTISGAIERMLALRDVKMSISCTDIKKEGNYDSCPCNRKQTAHQKDQITVSYEVVVRAILRPQYLQDPLAQDILLKDFNLFSEHLNPPKREIVGSKGPCVVLPIIFNTTEPEKEASVPIANFNIDQKGEMPNSKNPWEPSDGKGFLLVKEQTIATQSTASNNKS